MKKTILIIISAACLMTGSIAFAAGDAAAGKNKSSSCVGCHGMNGKSNNPQYPNLAGQKEAYLLKAMKAYKDGGRKDAMMNTYMSMLADQDMADIAAYYASLK